MPARKPCLVKLAGRCSVVEWAGDTHVRQADSAVLLDLVEWRPHGAL